MKVKFFSAEGGFAENTKQFYRARGVFRDYTNKNFYEHVFELEVEQGDHLDNLIPPFGEPHFVGTKDLDLEDSLKQIAVERGVTLSVAESCTGGLVAHRITNVPGSSSYFEGGVVAYSDSMKIAILGVRKDSINASITGSDFALSVTGIAGPLGGTREKPVGTVWFGIRTPGGTERKRLLFEGSRTDIKFKVSSFAIFDLMRKIRCFSCK
jgi:nicotinamide mononucleotide (NMN) deamidase PncC